MATWPHFLSARTQTNWLQACTRCVLTAGTVAEANSSSVIRALGQVQVNNFRQSFHSTFEFVIVLIRQRFLRLVNGQIGVWDMVQLITACSLVQTIRIWRKQKDAQHNGSGSSDGPVLEDCNPRDSTTVYSRVDTEFPKTGKYGVLPFSSNEDEPDTRALIFFIRRRNHRSWIAEKVLQL